MNRFLLLIVLVFSLSGKYVSSQTTGSFLHNGITRSYTIFVPSTWSPDKNFPMLLALHGLTQTGNSMMGFSNFNAYAEEFGFIVVYPNGVSNSWNVGFPGGSTADDVGFLIALIDTVNAAYATDLNRIYSTGFSNGGFMSYRLACEAGDRIAAIASVAGTMTSASLSACQPSRNMPVMHIHGTNDFVVFYNGGFGNTSVNEVLTFWNTANECPSIPTIENLPDLVPEGSTVQKQTWTPCTDSTEVTFYKINGGGHTWPGSVGTTGSGNTNRDIIASEEIWKFVSRFQLPQVHTGTKLISAQKLSVYPNPAKGETVTISFAPSAFSSRLEILTTDGRIVHTQILNPGITMYSFTTRDLSKGIYFIKVSGKDKLLIVKMVVQ
jgi:polyhydroxybutyrate depolymerase